MMTEFDWLFDDSGRMREDVPPLLYPDRTYSPSDQFNALAPPVNDRGNNLDITGSVLDYLGIDTSPEWLNGWEVKPKRWSSDTGREPFYGVGGRYKF